MKVKELREKNLIAFQVKIRYPDGVVKVLEGEQPNSPEGAAIIREEIENYVFTGLEAKVNAQNNLHTLGR